jgi:hypothetical protein
MKNNDRLTSPVFYHFGDEFSSLQAGGDEFLIIFVITGRPFVAVSGCFLDQLDFSSYFFFMAFDIYHDC